MRKILSFCLLLTMSLYSTAQIKPTSASERLSSFEQRKKLLASSTINGTSFRNIGPSVMSGRVVDIAVNPDDPTNFYVAYATGGLWHTINNGQSFTPVFDSEAIITIGAVAVNWKSNIIG